MKKFTLSIVLTALLVFSITSSANAFPASVKKVELWAPEKMLKGNEYEILITLVGFSEEQTRFTIISNDESITSVIDRHVIIEPFKSHGIAKVKANAPGKGELFAISGDLLIKKSVEVVEPALTPSRLDLVLPDNIPTRAKIPAYVFLIDAFNNPLIAEEDIEVSISFHGNIIPMVNKTIIKQGMHYSKFDVVADGDGGIAAIANGLMPDFFETTLAEFNDNIELRVEVAPNPTATKSAAEVYAWLEKDGRIFIPDEDVVVTFVSEDSRFLGFSKSIHFSQPLERDLLSTGQAVIEKGKSFAHITAWTADAEIPAGFEKEVEIIALAEGYDGEETEVNIRKAVTKDPNVTRVFVLPDPAHESVDIILALYFDESVEEDAEIGVEQVQEIIESLESVEELEQLVEELELEVSEDLDPAFVGESLYAHVGTSFLLKPEFSRVRIDKDDLDLRDHYTIIHAQRTGRFGEANVFGAVDGTKGEITNVRIEKAGVRTPKISITPLPALTNVKQDMFLISGIDEALGADVKFKNLFFGTKPAVQIDSIEIKGPIAIVKATALDVSSGTVEGSAYADGFKGGSQMVSVFNPSIRKLLAFYPSVVHAGEPFPMVFYSADQNGNPIEIVEPLMSPERELRKMQAGLFFVSSNSERDVIFYEESTNPATAKITSFSNEISLEVNIDDTEVKFGSDMALTYNVLPSDSHVTLLSELPFTRDGKRFVIEATKSGPTVLTLEASREGFATVRKEIQIEITDVFGATNSGSGKEKFSSDALLKPNFTMLLAYAGILIAIAGAGFYIFVRKRLKRSPEVTSEGELTYLFRGCSAKWTLTLPQ